MDSEIERIRADLDRVQRIAIETRTLVSAVYDRLEDGESKLTRARQDEKWSLAYSEPEPLVSVRIATKNRAELLVERALASVRRQTYRNWEAVIVGSACTDDTEQRLAALEDPRIRFHNRSLDGPYPGDRIQRWRVAGVPSMNVALRMARGRWIAPLDDDDEWDDDHIEILLGAAREGDAELAYGRLRVYLNGERIDRELGEWPPQEGKINLGGCIYNAALQTFEHDLKATYAGEPHDWNLVRRLWEAGVRFTFLNRMVATYHADHLQQVFEPERPDR